MCPMQQKQPSRRFYNGRKGKTLYWANEEENKMKRWMALLMVAALLAAAASAMAEDAVLLPDGRRLLLTTERVGEQVRGADCEWEAIYRLDVQEEGAEQPLQSLYFTTLETVAQDDGTEKPWIKAWDLDFDGWPDLDILYLLGASNSQHTFFFWDAEQGRFLSRHIGWAWLSSFELLPEKGLIVNYIHDSAATGTKEIYRWQDGRLQLVRRGEIAWSEEDAQTLVLTLTEPDPAQANTKETYRQELNLRTAQAGEELALDQKREELLWQGL